MLDDLERFLVGWDETQVGTDYGSAIIELWAYVGDVLTFYQERNANEAYLGTAARRDSLLRLAEHTDYRPSPGAAASALVAFALAAGKTVTIPKRLRVGGIPAAGRPAPVFETDAAVIATADHNAIPLARTARARQFADLAAVQAILDRDPSPATAGDYTAFAAQFGLVFPDLAARLFGAVPIGSSASQATPSRTVVFVGIDLGLAPGRRLLILPRSSGTAQSNGELRWITGVLEDRAAKTTAVTFREVPSHVYPNDDDVSVYAFRAEAAPFGHDAPAWSNLSPFLTGTSADGKTDGPYKNRTWDDTSSEAAYLPHDPVDPRTLFLDRVYDGVVPSSENAASFVVLVDVASPDVDPPRHQTLGITASDKVTHSDFTLTSKVTRLRLAADMESFDDSSSHKGFRLRATIVLAESVRLVLAPWRRLPDKFGGAVLSLRGRHPELESGKQVIVDGRAYDDASASASPDVQAEDAIVDRVEILDAEEMTLVRLQHPVGVGRGFARSTTVVRANVVPASHGETVRDEILGSGDGTAWQRFALKKTPLTYVQDPTADRGLKSTLHVFVSRVEWREREDFLKTTASTRCFVARQDLANRTEVLAGDGIVAARPPSGRDNVRGTYRWGLGTAGALDAGALTKLVDGVPGVQAVTNPLPTAGGADPETGEQLRSNVPSHLRTFGRAVSLDDYTSIALSYPGVVRASASWIVHDAADPTFHGVRITIATANGKPLVAQREYGSRFRRFMDASRDASVPLRIVDFTPVYVDFAIRVDVQEDHGREATQRGVLAALNPRRNPDGLPGFFGALNFGEGIDLSAIYATVQRVDGVRAAVVTTLRRTRGGQLGAGDPAGTVLERIPIPPTSLAMIADDPRDAANERGRLVVSIGEGGFAE